MPCRTREVLPVNAETPQVVAQHLNTLVGLLVERLHVQGAVEMPESLFRRPAGCFGVVELGERGSHVGVGKQVVEDPRSVR